VGFPWSCEGKLLPGVEVKDSAFLLRIKSRITAVPAVSVGRVLKNPKNRPADSLGSEDMGETPMIWDSIETGLVNSLLVHSNRNVV
jgi:hypothetical protein